jgi:hypothetical protein
LLMGKWRIVMLIALILQATVAVIGVTVNIAASIFDLQIFCLPRADSVYCYERMVAYSYWFVYGAAYIASGGTCV